jgi:AraC-like DNA-binding protein
VFIMHTGTRLVCKFSLAECDDCLTWFDAQFAFCYKSVMRGRHEQIHLENGQSFRLLRWRDNLREVDSLLAGGRVGRIVGEGMNWHYHAEMELTQFTAGEGIRFVGDHIAPFAAGEVVLLGQNLPHHWHTRGPSSGLSLQWRFPAGHAFWSFPETFPLASLFQTSGRGMRYTGKTAAEVSRILNAMESADSPERLGLLLRLFARLVSAKEKDQSFLSKRSFSFPVDTHHRQAVSEAVRYLLAHFREEIRLPEVLDVVHMSKPTFARQFRKHSGKSFSEFLTQIRLRAACQELEGTDRPVLEIALANGFSHVSFFNRVFRRILHSTPTCYREKGRKYCVGLGVEVEGGKKQPALC